MPTINKTLSSRKNKKFVKKDYRAWDLTGDATTQDETSETSEKGKKPTQEIKKHHKNHGVNEHIVELQPSEITRWAFKDRPENELGDIGELAKTLKEIGQQVPCIVRPASNGGGYELIAGERRWHAAQLAGMGLKVLIKELTDHDAGLIQAIENEQRQDLSDYAKGMSYARMLDKGILRQKDLIETLQISQQQVSRLLSFRKMPTEIIEELGDMTKISSRTSVEIVRLSKKGDEYINAISKLAGQISAGKLGGQSLVNKVTKIISKAPVNQSTNKKVLSKDGRHIFTWRLDNNTNPSIHFPKDILDLFNTDRMSFDKLTKNIGNFISSELTNLKDT